MTVRAVLYLHGFRSSPASAKARRMLAEAQARGWRAAAPDLNVPPLEAAARADEAAKALAVDPSELLIVGSSLGGFYAGRLACKLGAKAALLNPCLDPWTLIGPLVGWHEIAGTDRRIHVDERFGPDLKRLDDEISPVPQTTEERRRTWVLLSDEDEVLDWHKARDAMRGCRIVVSPGDDHRIRAFDDFVPTLAAWAADDPS